MSTRILVVAGDLDALTSVVAIARDHYLVEMASDRQAAWAAIHRYRPDLVLLAALTPSGDELALLRELRSQPSTSTIPVVIISRPEDEEFRIGALLAGANDHLREPVGARELLARMEFQLSVKRVPSQHTGGEAALQRYAERNRQALRDRDAFRAFVHQSSDGIIIMDGKGTVLEWNEGEERITGLPRSQVVGRPIWEVQCRLYPHVYSDPDLVRRVTERAVAALSEGVDLRRTVEEEIQRLDGSRRVVQSVLFAIRSGDELLIGCISRDVTEQRRNDQRLRESEERLALAIEASGQGLWDWDIAADKAYLSPEYLSLTGLTDSNVVSAMAFFRGSVHPEDLPLLDKAMRDNIEGRSQSAIVDARLLKQSGEYVWMRLVGRVTGRDHCGTPTRVTGVLTDISERRRLEVELRERQALLLEGERLARLGHWHRDLRTGEAYWSDEIYRILGHAPGAFMPSEDAFLEQLDTADRERVGGAVIATAIDGITRRGEYRIVSPAGTTRHVQGTVELLRDANGAPARIFGTAQDITERKKMEQALADANRYKDEFLAVLSHELRNPLAPIRSSLDVLARVEPGGEQARRMLAVIERQISHLTRLVDDLLDVSRISRGKIQLRHTRLDLVEVVRRTVEDYRAAFVAGGVELETRLAGSPLWINGDVTRVAQMLGNLLANATKFTPRGGKVEVTLGVEPDGGVVLQVRDTGVGISDKMLRHVFEPFIQADRGLDRARGGLGLGLALVKGLAELHGGSVSAASDGPGLGAQFTIRLPLTTAAAEAAPALAALRVQPLRILLIEDNIDAAAALKEALQSCGHQVEVAHNGSAGLDKARVFVPDVVLCDIGLPGMNGYEVARALRSDEGLRGTFLAALTGYALPDDVQRARDAGFERHLAKPVGLASLAELLSEVRGA